MTAAEVPEPEGFADEDVEGDVFEPEGFADEGFAATVVERVASFAVADPFDDEPDRDVVPEPDRVPLPRPVRDADPPVRPEPASDGRALGRRGGSPRRGGRGALTCGPAGRGSPGPAR